MAIPLATTTINVQGRRPQSAVDPDADGYDTPQDEPPIFATGVRASITLPQGTRGNRTADEIDSYTLRCDPIPEGLSRYDIVTDTVSGNVFEVVWVADSLPVAYGLEHIKAKLQIVRGVNSGGETDEFARV